MPAWRTELTLAEHIARLQTDLMALNEHGTQSLAALTKGRSRLFQSLFVFENYPMPVTVPLGMSSARAIPVVLAADWKVPNTSTS